MSEQRCVECSRLMPHGGEYVRVIYVSSDRSEVRTEDEYCSNYCATADMRRALKLG
jgi:hypothetical protein